MARLKWNTRVNAFEKAAVQVLARAKRPLTIREITERMIAEELVRPTGRTPERSLYAIIRRSNQRAEAESRRPAFRVHHQADRVVRYSLDRSRS